MADETPWANLPAPPPPPGLPPTPAPPYLSPPGQQTPSGDGYPGDRSADDPFDDTRPEPGSLHLRGGRAWKTWQLVLAVLVAAVVGMWFNGNTASDTSASASSNGSGAYKLPAPSGSSGSPTTTAGGSGSSPATSPATLAPATVLVPATQLTGDWTSPVFNIAGGTWNIGWAFACSPVPAATPTFAVFVVNAGANPGPGPAVTSSAATGQSVTPQTTTGSQQIDVRAPAGCRWAVKVTGSSS